jgi:hypothetical protein
MFNTHKPSKNDLPTSSQLLKSTMVAICVGCALLILFVLPAEYGTDPTGVGELLGLKKMGEIKTRLKQDFLKENIGAKDELMVESETGKENQDVMEFVIAPDEAIEIKLEMKKGSIAKYKWTTKNGGLNYNLHGDGYNGSQQSISYKKGRMTNSDSGEFKSKFDGYHGWFWRNRNNESVTVTLETFGDYILIKQMK